jgi:hypothetical protein
LPANDNKPEAGETCSIAIGVRIFVHAPVKKNVVIPDATHFVLFERKRFEFFDQVLKFLRDQSPKQHRQIRH